MRLLSHGATALKAVAMLPHALVHLVAGAGCHGEARVPTPTPAAATPATADADAPSSLASSSPCGRVVTTYENNAAHGSVRVSCEGVTRDVAAGTLRKEYSGCQWAWHNGTGYLLPGSPVLVTNGQFAAANLFKRMGQLSSFRIRSLHQQARLMGVYVRSSKRNRLGGHSSDLVERPLTTPGPEANASLALFSLATAHTGGPAASWLVALPGVSLAGMPAAASAARANTRVVANTAGAQAVLDHGLLLAVVWRAGVLHTLNTSTANTANTNTGAAAAAIQADRPCVVLVRPAPTGDGLVVTASDPTNNQRGGTLHITIVLRGQGAGAGAGGGAAVAGGGACVAGAGGVVHVSVPLPAGFNAGRSATVTCSQGRST